MSSHIKAKTLLVVDYYSKYMYPEVVEIEDNTATTIVIKMKEIFARHGIPEELMSDNMPFDSQEFRRFTRNWGIKVDIQSVLDLPSPMAKVNILSKPSRG